MQSEEAKHAFEKHAIRLNDWPVERFCYPSIVLCILITTFIPNYNFFGFSKYIYFAMHLVIYYVWNSIYIVKIMYIKKAKLLISTIGLILMPVN